MRPLRNAGIVNNPGTLTAVNYLYGRHFSPKQVYEYALRPARAGKRM